MQIAATVGKYQRYGRKIYLLEIWAKLDQGGVGHIYVKNFLIQNAIPLSQK